MCSTCIFRPGNLMHLRSGRLRDLVDTNLANDSAIVCHKTLHGPNAICRGFFDRHQNDTLPLRLAQFFGNIRYQEPE